MLILALDTALDACQAAVLDGERVLASRTEPMSRGHQERLAPMVRQVMDEAAVGFDALDRIAVTIGPGSFTGVRVGLAFAKGLSLALSRPCVGVETLEALAQSVGAPGLTAALIDARRGRVYLQRFRDGAPLDEPDSVDLLAASAELAATLEPLTLAGPGVVLLAAAFAHARVEARAWPDLTAVARLATRRPAPDARPSPLYLRAPDARTIAERTGG